MSTMVLDIGGTAIKSGLYQNGALSEIRETATEAAKGGPHVVNRAMEIIRKYKKTKK